MGDWDPELYLAFEKARTRPCLDLLARVPHQRLPASGRVVDLGCGPGNSTEILRNRFPTAKLVGLDSSPQMLEKARTKLPDVDFVEGFLENWKPSDCQHLIFSNALMHWIPDHKKWLSRLAHRLCPSGWLALQFPDTLDELSHRAMEQTAAQGDWKARLSGIAGERAKIGLPSDYYDWLAPYYCEIEIWKTEYLHILPSHAAIVSWMHGAGLTPYLSRLKSNEISTFLQAYTERIVSAYPVAKDNCVVLRYPRVFIVARRRDNPAGS